MAEDRLTRFEDLPDELLLVICSYLHQLDVLLTFTDLNIRISRSIAEYLRKIDLNDIPLTLARRFREQIFPRIRTFIHRLVLADDCQRFAVDRQHFPHLQSLQFGRVFSLDHLLNIERIQIDLVPADLQIDLMRQFFTSADYSNLRSLSFISYHGSTFSNLHWSNVNPIETLTITLKNNVDLFELLHLLSSTIATLHIHILYNGPFQPLTSTPLKLVRLRRFHLKTTFEHAIRFEQLSKLLIESIASLESLSIETLTRDADYLNGHRWEKSLRQLPSLRTFQCSIRYRSRINDDDNVDEFEATLSRSFSTDFWLRERRWFVQFYSTVSTTNESLLLNSFRINAYRKTFLFTVPYPYESIDVTSDITKSQSTLEEAPSKFVFANVRHLYFDGENLPITVGCLQDVFDRFQWIEELKLDRLIIDTSVHFPRPLRFRHLNKFTLYSTPDERCPLNVNFLDLSAMPYLHYLRLPHASLPDASHMPADLHTLILTDCRDQQFYFLHRYVHLRLLRLHLTHFDRLLDNRGLALLTMIKSIYTNNDSLECLQLMCPGSHPSKVKLVEKHFNALDLDHLSAFYDNKCFAVRRAEQFFAERDA